MKKRNVIIALIVVIAIVLGGLVIWKPSSQVKEFINKIEKKVEPDVYQNLKEVTNDKIKLVEAKIALLKAKVAMEIVQSQQTAEKELDNAMDLLSDVKSDFNKKRHDQIEVVRQKIGKAKESIKKKSLDAGENVSAAIEETEALIKEYESKMKDVKKEEEEQLNDQYVKLQAQAALLKAKLASKSKDTYDQAYNNLEEAKRWYRHNNYEASKMIDSTNQKMIEKINEAQEYLKEKKDEAGVLISDIYSKASELVKDDDQ